VQRHDRHRDPTSTQSRSSAFSIIFGILGVLGVLVSVVAIWANQVLFDSDSVGNAVEQTLLEPEVTDALAVFLTDQVLEAVDINELVAEKLPDNLTALSPVIAGGARTVVQEAFERVLANDSTRAVIVAASERAHDRVMQVLEGGSLTDGANVENGEVSLNLLAIIGNGLQSLQDAGLLTRVDLPEFDTSADPPTRSSSSRTPPAGICPMTSGRSSSTRASRSPPPRRRSPGPSRPWCSSAGRSSPSWS